MTRMNEPVWKLAQSGAVVLAALLVLSGTRVVAQQDKSPAKSAASEPRKQEPSSATTQPYGQEVLVPTRSLREMASRAGPVFWLLIACSVIGLAFVFERLVSLRQARVIPKPFVTRFLQQVRDGDLDRERALAICEDNPSPIAAVFGAAVRKWGRPSVEVEQAIIDAGERVTYGLRRYLRVFTALAVIGPLLGLLGTVIGMIHAFNAVAFTAAQGRPQSELLALGISEALLNTALGLVLAIPAQSLYLYFVSRVDRLVIEMDRLGQQLVQMISAEDVQIRMEAQARARRSVRKEPTA